MYVRPWVPKKLGRLESRGMKHQNQKVNPRTSIANKRNVQQQSIQSSQLKKELQEQRQKINNTTRRHTLIAPFDLDATQYQA